MPREIAELCLAHDVGNAVERAYRRSDLLEKRRALMERIVVVIFQVLKAIEQIRSTVRGTQRAVLE